MTWWMWLLAGFLLLLLELVTPGGFFVLFFGAGAIVVGIMAMFGVAGGQALQWLLFSVLSVCALLLFRKPLLERMRRGQPPGEVDSLVGETAVAMSDISAGEVGKAELRGTAWTARNIGDQPVTAGQRCRVEQVDGLMIGIRG